MVRVAYFWFLVAKDDESQGKSLAAIQHAIFMGQEPTSWLTAAIAMGYVHHRKIGMDAPQ